MMMEQEHSLEQMEALLSGQLTADSEGVGLFPGAGPGSDPLAWAAQARRVFGDRVRIYGFWCFENPSATLMGELRERHDFAVLDRRWIVDLWMRRFHAADASGLVDLASTECVLAASHVYGDPNCWERDTDMECRMDGLSVSAPIAAAGACDIGLSS